MTLRKTTALMPLLAAMVGRGAVQATCDSSRVKVQMLWTGGPELFGERASTSYLVWLDDKARVIVDTGPGSVQRFKKSGAKFEDIELMLFTHFHVDHSADFPA